MSWATVAGVVGGVYNAWQSRDADTAARESNERAMDFATKQYDYQLHNVGMFQDTLRANIGIADSMNFGGGFEPVVAQTYGASGYSAEGYEAQGYTAQEIEELARAQGDNQAGIAAAQGMMDDWESTFGGLEENLSDYFNNLDPDKYATESKIALQQNIDKSMAQFNDTMAASGLQSAGMKQQAAKEAAFMQATGNAQIDSSAEQAIAEQQMGFLSYGQNEKMQAQNLLSGATNLDSQMRQSTSIFNAQSENQMNMFNTDAVNQSSMFNANADNAASAFNANANNQAAAFNASAANQAAQFNAGAINSANIFNTGLTAQADQMRDTATLGAYNNFANSYLTKANIVDPRIAIEQGNAANYGASSAGYATAAGTALGAGIKAWDASDFGW